jgi:hypothetical protein
VVKTEARYIIDWLEEANASCRLLQSRLGGTKQSNYYSLYLVLPMRTEEDKCPWLSGRELRATIHLRGDGGS